MFTFIIAVVLLILGYLIYGKAVDRNFGPDDRTTPAIAVNDGVDFIPMKTWKVFLIQLLNIAGTGPIFGALSGALFGPIAYLWVIFGCILGGGVHDYMTGMISMRKNGSSISEITGEYLGKGMLFVMRIFSVILLVMCGVVFTTGPAQLLAILTPNALNTTFWLIVVLVYYFLATFLPIDKIIGKIYPIFGGCLIFMALGVTWSMLLQHHAEMPELWNNFANMHAKGTDVWPFMFVTIACGAISGFHATQSPLMARCVTSERQGRLIFYGAMVAEGIIALIWVAAGLTFYEDSQALLNAGGGCSAVVYYICNTAMGKVGAVIAIIGVIACPISSGDTALRAARLTISDWFKIDQKNIKKRIFIAAPLIAIAALICQIDYSVVWQYFSFCNQTLAMIVLWAASVYLKTNGRNCIFTVFPAMFMSAVSVTYFVASPECLGKLWTVLGVGYGTYYTIGIVTGIAAAIAFLFIFVYKMKARTPQADVS